MTLCAAWIRQGNNDEGKELVFATDSRLRGGEAWDNGLKLFDLGRSDCLLCFAGDTRRAYPLILQAMTAARTDVEWTNPRIDLYNIRDSLCNLFTRICREIADLPHGEDVHRVRAEAQFFFGGWSWREQELKIWKLYYARDLESFTHQSMNEGEDDRVIVFLGDEIETAERLMGEELNAANKVIRGSLDMEPVRVLARMARDTANYETIGGALQIGKVYRSGHNEFLGVIWPSFSGGRPHFMGKEINPYDAPPVRFIDPDTTNLIEHLPTEFGDVEQFNFGSETRFIQDAYPDHKLKTNLTEAHRMRLSRIFRDTAYQKFVQDRESAPNSTPPAGNSENAND